MNLSKAAKVIEFVRQQGVVDFCLCAGARNSPLIALLDENRSVIEQNGQLFSFFEERSAAFFALGRSQQTKRPVAIITTSGTAATELISAAVEAYYTQTPLLFITADRPPRYRQTGAPQSIEQVGIFTHYAHPTVDLDNDLSLLDNYKEWDQTKPLHLNVCFGEPLLQGTIPKLARSPEDMASNADLSSLPGSSPPLRAADLHPFFDQCKRPLFIISGLSLVGQNQVLRNLRGFEGAWWTESLSGLRGHPDLERGRIKSGERLIQSLIENKIFDGVIRLGSVPTTRVWRDLEERFAIPVLSLTESCWSGLARPSTVAPLQQLETVITFYGQKQAPGMPPVGRAPYDQWRKLDQSLFELLSTAIASFPRSELAMVRQLSRWVGQNSLYLGNSLPIREWDWVAEAQTPKSIAGNRGANGIDGQISSFLGWKPSDSHCWALLGDLTTMYDLAAPWILTQLQPHHQNFTLVIMNNSGGQIFNPMFGREAFLNRHQFEFSGWAQMWGLRYAALETMELTAPMPLPQILELRPSEIETQALRKEIERLWKTHLL